ncbi:Prolyl 3-hydroxylase OGFOD1 [Smittium culicis]|uniref:Prolyl 3-hydroxylase OGFOD1 n=1 Tax=Smittium culicis TaxID=133412 RepID=A0A1R1XEY0_9FUNG|nr:Prolyl 3-hydroxylase OGFOD1 [Smittium culicis]
MASMNEPSRKKAKIASSDRYKPCHSDILIDDQFANSFKSIFCNQDQSNFSIFEANKETTNINENSDSPKYILVKEDSLVQSSENSSVQSSIRSSDALDKACDKKVSTIIGSPFKVGVLYDLFEKSFLLDLKSELANLKWNFRSNDLYEFYQTDDLKIIPNNIKSDCIKNLYNYLSSDEFVTFMERISGSKLVRGRIDLAAQQYKKGGYLLCHDDYVSGEKLRRKIAYIIYLVEEDWKYEDGGCLGLYRKDERGLPTDIVKKLVPKFNSMSFFITGENSFHEVEEVLRDDNISRWSVTGWFYESYEANAGECSSHQSSHSKLEGQSIPLCSVTPIPISACEIDDNNSILNLFINNEYLSPSSQDQILDNFLDNSSIELKDIFNADIYNNFVNEICDPKNIDRYWENTKIGPPTLRKYSVFKKNANKPDFNSLLKDFAQNSSNSHSIKSLENLVLCVLHFLNSEQFSKFLCTVTNLELKSSIQEVRKLDVGDYTLMHDSFDEPEGLDVIFSFLPNTNNNQTTAYNWDSQRFNGTTHYVSGSDELLTIEPDRNTLSIVYRTEETKRFVKKIISNAEHPRFEVGMIFTE